jgi:sugar phosphate isomerase/epimerase
MLPGIGFSLQANYDLPMTQMIPMLKHVGFSALSPAWTSEAEIESIADCARQNGMALQSLHAPHKNTPVLWAPDTPESLVLQEGILRCIDTCARLHIPLTVIHGWQGLNYTFPTSPLDFRFFDRAVAHAKEKQVSIAFENLEGEEYLTALLTRYQGETHVGFCWDSGHDHCYPHKTNFLKAYGDRLIMTHLNDNLGLRDPGGVPTGNDDLHFLPYDGNIRWEDAIGRLKNYPKQHILNFELKKRSASTAPGDLLYDSLSTAEYFRLAGCRARRIADLYDR